MKVTVCFGSVRVIVPCGSGHLLVSDLTEKAVLRYKKATGKPPDYWVTVHNLKSQSDGGILDPDDQLSDVADDREQIIAIYEEQDGPLIPHNGGDGTSASSVGTSSPEMFSGNDPNDYGPVRLRHAGKNDVIITQNDLSHGSTLIVRRGSEPALNTVGTSNIPKDTPPRPPRSNRWSAIDSIEENKSPRDTDTSDDESGSSSSYPRRRGGSGQEKSAFSRFARDSARQSLASSSSSMYRWLEAQSRREELYQREQVLKDSMYKDGRKEPLGGSGNAEDDENDSDMSKTQDSYLSNGQQGTTPSEKSNLGVMVVLKNTGGPLGIHVVPDYDDSGRDTGLVIQSIEAGGRIFRDGRLQAQDRIIEINNTSLVDVNFDKAQAIFHQALKSDELRLRVIKSDAPPLPKHLPPAVLPKPPESAKRKPADLDLNSSQGLSSKGKDSERNKVPENVSVPSSPTKSSGSGSQPGSPSKKTPPAVPARHPSTTLTSPSGKNAFSAAPNQTNTRKIGKKFNIVLTKEPPGLGFSVTTRDNSAGSNSPIYIKNILPKGAAIQDGNLKSGDRLLEVNGIPMTGKSQAEAVSILRNTKLGSQVTLLVSRQVIEEDKFAVPRELNNNNESPQSDKSPSTSEQSSKNSDPVLQPPEKAGDDGNLAPNKNKDILRFRIPLNETGSAGLGLSVKGKTTTDSKMQDLGIFIKSVIAGGAASKDGNLKVNDQLVEINGGSLLGKSNQDAMEALRKAMQKEGSTVGYIDLVVARRREPQAAPKHEPSPLRELRVSHSEPPDGLDANGSVIMTKPINNKPGMNDINSSEVPKLRNPLLDRLTGGNPMAVGNNIRNESYIRATHDSLNETQESVLNSPGKKNQKMVQSLSSPTINSSNQGEMVLIEGDNYQMQMKQEESPSKRRSQSTPGLNTETEEVNGSPRKSASNEDDDCGAPKPPEWLERWVEGDGELSPEDDPSKTFQREGFGRQSMSEKRRGHADPRISEFYRKMKNSKTATYDRRRRPISYHCDIDWEVKDAEFGPTLGLKKCSSLESLQTAVQEATQDEDSLFKHPNLGMVRGRGCNESFRAAVDRSYDDNGAAEVDQMERLEEEEGSERGSTSHERPSIASSTRSSFSENEEGLRSTGEEPGEGAEPSKKGLKKTKSKKDKDKDKGGLFKGLGHMFRFGRHRKGVDERTDSTKATSSEDLNRQQQADMLKAKQEEIDKQRVRQKEEQEKINEQYRKLQEKQRQLDAQRMHAEQLRHQEALQAERSGSPAVPQTRAERIAALRAEHQRRHRERQGQYPLEDQEELYERQLQELESGPVRTGDMGNRGDEVGGRFSAPPPRRHSEVNYESRPASQAYEGADHFSHYQNFNEIQAQIHRQQQYHEHYRAYLASRQAERDRIMAEKNQRERERLMAEQQQQHQQRTMALLDPLYQDRYAHRQSVMPDMPPPGTHWHPTSRSVTPGSMMGGRISPNMRPHSSAQLSYVPVGHPHPHPHTRPHPHPHSYPHPVPMPHNMHPGTADIQMGGPPQVSRDMYGREYYDYDDPRTAYSDVPYGSLPRSRSDTRGHNGMISGPAQV